MLLGCSDPALRSTSSTSISTISNSSTDVDTTNSYLDNPTSLKVGDQLRLAWNYLRFGWVFTLPPNLSPGEPIHFLGKRYIDLKRGELKTIRSGCLDGDFEAFMDDFRSRLWFTYRDEFPPIPLVSLPLFQNGRGLQSPKTSFSTISGSSENTNAPLRSTAEFRRRLSSTSARQSQRSKLTTNSANHDSDIGEILLTSSPPLLKIPLSTRTSDCGWGCMLRSAQMLVAQALVTHFLGRDWTYLQKNDTSRRDPTARMHRHIVRWFADTPESPLSIHRLVQASGKPPGTWFGPASIFGAFVVAMAIAGQNDSLLGEIEIYLARDRVICSEEVLNLFHDGSRSSSLGNGEYSLTDHTGNYKRTNGVKRSSVDSGASSYSCQPSRTVDDGRRFEVVSQTGSSESLLLIGEEAKVEVHPQPPIASIPTDHPLSIDLSEVSDIGRRGLLLIVTMRLGVGSRIDPIYIPTLLHLLRDPSCVGLVGGRPKHSVYAAGSQANRLIIYDPHFCQNSVNVQHKCFNLDTWHCTSLRVMLAKRLDPSCALGFYCGSRMQLEQLLKRLPRLSEIRSSIPRRANNRLIEVVSASEASQLFCPTVVAPLDQTTTSNCNHPVDNML